MQDTTPFKISGWIKIFDPITDEIFINKQNSIHYENMSISMAECLANHNTGWIDSLCFGNGGSSIGTDGIITYLTPNSVGTNSQLYNETYCKVIDGHSVNNHDPIRNNLEIRHVSGSYYTDIFVTCLLDYDEPEGQQAFDAANTQGPYVFDEMGLKSFSPSGDSRLLTHVIFHPVQKSLNRLLEIDYTLRIQSSHNYGEE